MKKVIFFSLLPLLLISCGSKTTSSELDSSSEEPSSSSEIIDNHVSVFVLAGQSNMEGNTFVNPYLSNFLTSEGITGEAQDPYFKGFENVLCSYYNKYSNSRYNYSNKTEPESGLFLKTRAGFGVTGSNYFGPEVGLAETLFDYATEDNPIFLIKYTAGATGFYTGNSWMAPTGKLFTGLNNFVFNNLTMLEDHGYIPVIKGFLWMQGETDNDSASHANAYHDNYANLVAGFRENFAEYGPNEDGDKIASIDASIYDGPATAWSRHKIINGAKAQYAEEGDYNFYVDTTCASGIALQINQAEHAGGDIYHYTADSMIKLGRAFGQTIIDNKLL